jgi:hypothetical protein
MAVAGDHRHRHPARQLLVGQVASLEVAVPGRLHLAGGRQVEPELKAFHQALFLLGQFGVDHAAARGHPLHAAVFEQALVAGAVAVAHAPGDHVGHGLEAAVRMVGKARDVVVGLVAAKGVEHQEGVEPVLQILREHAGELDAGPVRSRLAIDQPLDAAR